MPEAKGPLRRAALKGLLAAREVVALGPDTMAAIARNSLACEREARRQRRAAPDPGPTRAPGSLVRAEAASGPDGSPVGLRCTFEEAELELRFLAEDLVRVTWAPGLVSPPWALGGPLADGGDTPVEVDLGARPTAASPALAVEVAADGSLTYRRPGGPVLRRELAPLRQGARISLRSLLRPGERVGGLGEQAAGVDLRGTTHRLWNRDPGGAWGSGQDPLYCTIPVLVGLHPEGDVLTFFDNPHDGRVSIDGPGAVGATPGIEVAFSSGALRHYVAVGPLPRLLERYSELTGGPPLPPRWALGYHQCRWGYKDEADVREVAEGFAALGLPLSAVHLDIDYMDGYRVFSIDPARFPDLPALAQDLASSGTRVVTIVDPAVKVDPGDDVYRQGVDGGHFVEAADGGELRGTVWPGWAAFPDFTDPATRTWWGGLVHRLTDAGVAGLWFDMNEPTSITLWGDRTLPVGSRHSIEGHGGDHGQAHNVYGLLMDRTGWEALAAVAPGRRPFVLSRSGWAGLGRWAFNWTGDIESSWEGLAQQVATVIGLGLSGVPFSGCDVGGFSGNPSPELYLRWLELSTFLPFCRTHSVLGAPPREPWRFPEPERSAIGRLIRFRYRLLPYLYTLAHQASVSGHPLVRHPAWPADGDQGTDGDPRLWSDDAFVLGPSLLVAPVTRPGATSRRVALPAGRWFAWRPLPAADGSPAAPEATALEGGRTLVLDAPAGQGVLAVAEGTVLPLDDGWAEPAGAAEGGDQGRLDAEHGVRVLGLHCFATGDGRASGTHYDDAGDGYGESRLDRFELAPDPDRGWTLTWTSEGPFPRPLRVRVVLHGVAATAATADGTDVIVQAGQATVVETGPFERLRLT